ncbi:MAG: hypothetical protein ACREVA_06405, partial [Burkholderiales bacterium]
MLEQGLSLRHIQGLL